MMPKIWPFFAPCPVYGGSSYTPGKNPSNKRIKIENFNSKIRKLNSTLILNIL